jgi:hypothetical protein
MKVLNITNGDGAGEVIKASVLPGDVLPWRDPMHHGPFPANATLDDLRTIRAHHLAGHGLDQIEVERDFQLRDESLRSANSYDRVILWFEHDLLDQLQILQLLDFFSTYDLKETELELICINSFPGFENFRGVGELTPTQMASLLPQSISVTSEMKALARAGWASFQSNNPRHLLEFQNKDLQCLPFLRPALLRHFEEYPSSSDGLTRTEGQLLSLVAEGIQNPNELFRRNMELETALFIGDWSTYAVIQRLCRAKLLVCDPAPFWYFAVSAEERQAFKDQRLIITAKGRAILGGDCDPANTIERDQWLGGVHIQSGYPHWVWNAEMADFVFIEI